tara:strand:- start:229 stop:675 length:447 start_codon:yes stop_codon:yes gene_type:complete
MLAQRTLTSLATWAMSIFLAYHLTSSFTGDTGVNGLADNIYKACWNVSLADENYFCYGAVAWPLDEETYYNAEEIDQEAKDMYRALLFKWQNRTRQDEQEDPTSACLAVSRDIICAHKFRRCKNYLVLKEPLCAFMCSLLRERCPAEK